MGEAQFGVVLRGELFADETDEKGFVEAVDFVADHGEALDEHLDARGYAYDHGEFLDPEVVRIPLLLAGPGIAPGRSTQTVSIRDVYTAILEAAGIGDPTAAQEGRRDLQRPSDATRAVGIERRAIGESDRNAVSFFRFHAGAAAEGRRLVVVGEDGGATLGKVAFGGWPTVRSR